MEENTRKELIDYYKWIVNLSIFIITITASVVSASSNLRFSNMLSWGLAFLVISICFNWLLIKRLVSTPIVENTPIKDIKITHLIFTKSTRLAKIYGLIQNWAFVIGIILVVVSFIFGYNIVHKLPKLL